MSRNRQVYKKDVVLCRHNGILLSNNKNESLPFMTTWLDLEGIILSEISQGKASTI